MAKAGPLLCGAGVSPVKNHGQDAHATGQARTDSFSFFFSLRLCAFALICCSLLASSSSASYPPETEGLHTAAHSDCLGVVLFDTFRGKSRFQSGWKGV